MPHDPFHAFHANPAESVSGEGTKFEHPTGKKLIFDRFGRAYRILGMLRGGDGRLSFKLETINPNETKQQRQFSVDKAELGGRYDTQQSSAPARIIGTRRVRDRRPDLSFPHFLGGTPGVNTLGDCLVVNLEASEEVRAAVYYDLAAAGGPWPVYDLGPGFGHPSPTPPIPSNFGGDFGPYEPGSDPYTFPFSYGYRGYSFAERVADFRTEHIIEVCGLVTNVTYNVLVCIWDKSGNGPICSRNITIFLPTP